MECTPALGQLWQLRVAKSWEPLLHLLCQCAPIFLAVLQRALPCLLGTLDWCCLCKVSSSQQPEWQPGWLLHSFLRRLQERHLRYQSVIRVEWLIFDRHILALGISSMMQGADSV